MGVYDQPVDAFADLRTAGRIRRRNGRALGAKGVDPAYAQAAQAIIDHLVARRSEFGVKARPTDAWWTAAQSIVRGTDACGPFTPAQACDLVDFAMQSSFWHTHIVSPAALMRFANRLYASDEYVAWSMSAGRPPENRPRSKTLAQPRKPGARPRIDPDRKRDPSEYRSEM